MPFKKIQTMASGFFAILDDIAALMDDVAVTAKMATQKTAGILGDDLAVNAEKATGFLESREIPVLMKIMKGSFINKLIIVPIVFLLQWLYEPAINIILIFGGLFLAYEGMEKIIEFLFHREKKGHEVIEEAVQPETAKDSESAKVKSAITTDFILSLEIVIIALASAKEGYEALKSQFDPLLVEIVTVSIVSIIATVGVYGIVALIVRMDDAGYKIIKKSKKEKGFLVWLGNLLVNALPWVIKGLGVLGTVALILVAGGIFVHYIDWIHHHFLPNINSTLREALMGIIGGLIAIPIFTLGKKALALVKK